MNKLIASKMPNTIKIKRSVIHAIPTELAWGELAWTEFQGEKNLYIGGVDGSIIAIASSSNNTAVLPDILLPAAENLTAGMVVNIYSNETDVLARPAIASIGIEGKAHGYVVENFFATETARIYTRRGSVFEIPGLTPGVRYYLSDTQPGKLTATPVEMSGHILQLVGNCVFPNKLEFSSEDAIIRA